MNVTVVCATDP